MKSALIHRGRILATTLLLASGLAGAAPVLLTSGSKATGIQDLVVDGINYDVSFVFGSYNAVFGSSVPTFFGNSSGAEHARDAIWSLLNGSSLTVGNLNGYPAGNLSVVDRNAEFSSSWFHAKRTSYQDGTGTVWQNVTYGDLQGDKNTDYSGNIGFAVFTADPQVPDPRNVPEPGSAALVGIALLGLGLFRRKQH